MVSCNHVMPNTPNYMIRGVNNVDTPSKMMSNVPRA